MKTEKITSKYIIDTLNIGNSQVGKKYAAKLLQLFLLINELEKLDGFKVSLNGNFGNVQLVNMLPELQEENYRHSSIYWEAKKQQDNCREVYGLFEMWQQITVFHSAGEYKFNFPMNNSLYNILCGMAGEIVQKKETTLNVVDTITINPEIFGNIDKALKSVSKDELRPAMTAICLDMEGYNAQIVSTDAHRLYLSKKYECSQKDRKQLLIPVESAKKLAKMKFASDIIEISILPGNQISIEGFTIDLLDERFPDYRYVLPTYNTYMEFDKKSFMDNIKAALPFANKATNQVTFHLNGSIAMNCCDIDFCFENNREMAYISKNFTDTDIAFNGKFLLDAMKSLKGDKVKMYSEGHSSRPTLFSNDIDTVLVMPLML